MIGVDGRRQTCARMRGQECQLGSAGGKSPARHVTWQENVDEAKKCRFHFLCRGIIVLNCFPLQQVPSNYDTTIDLLGRDSIFRKRPSVNRKSTLPSTTDFFAHTITEEFIEIASTSVEISHGHVNETIHWRSDNCIHRLFGYVFECYL